MPERERFAGAQAQWGALNAYHKFEDVFALALVREQDRERRPAG